MNDIIREYNADGTHTDRHMTDAEQAAYDAIAKANVLPDLAAHRFAVETAGTTVNGIRFLTDRDSQVAIMGAMIMASSNPSYSVNWKTPDGFVTLTASQIIAAATTIANFVQKCFNTEAQLVTNASQYADSAGIVSAFDTSMSQ